MKNKHLLALLSVSLSAQAATAETTYLMDFNNEEELVNSGTYPSANWNTFGDVADINGSTLTNSAGGGSSVTLGLESGSVIARSSNDGTVVYDTNLAPSWVANGTSDTAAAADYFFTSVSDGSDESEFTINFGGLIAGSEVSLDLWTSRASGSNSGVGHYDYSLDGVSWTGFTVMQSSGALETAAGWGGTTTALSGGQAYQGVVDGNDAGRYMSTQTITLTGTTLQFRVKESGGGNWASVGAARLTVIPEPKSYALLAGVCGLTVVMLRRRS